MHKLEYIKHMYLDKGLKVFPVVENGKTPLIDAWQNDCSSDFLQVAYWLENAKNCNIGLPANENDLFVIDVDMHGVDGLANFHKLCEDLGVKEIKTWTQRTPSGGIHFIFKSDDELKNVINSANCFKDYQGIDIRTKGYILVQPSMINGIYYDLDIEDDLQPLPGGLRDFILNNNKDIVEEKKEYEKPEVVEKGGRDNALFEYILNLYYKTRLDKEEITLLANNFNEKVCLPPLSENVVKYKVDKQFNKPRYKIIVIGLNEEGEDVRDEL